MSECPCCIGCQGVRVQVCGIQGLPKQIQSLTIFQTYLEITLALYEAEAPRKHQRTSGAWTKPLTGRIQMGEAPGQRGSDPRSPVESWAYTPYSVQMGINMSHLCLMSSIGFNRNGAAFCISADPLGSTGV